MRASLLRQPDFRWFFTGRLVSLAGSSMAPAALALAVLGASRDPADLGVVLSARMAPLLAFLLAGGAVADRFPRRTVLVAVHLGSALTQGGVAWLLLAGRYSLPGVAALEFLNGLLGAFTGPALRGIVPQLAGAAELQRANSLLSSARNVTRIAGPSVSAALAAAGGGGAAIAADALTYLLAAACLMRLPPVAAAPASRRRPVLADVRDGWAQFRRIRWARVVTVSFCLMNLVQTGTWQILGPSLTTRLSGEAAWGLVLSARGAGLLAMSALMTRWTVRRLLRLGRLASALGALPLLALAARLPVPWLLASAFAAGLGAEVAGVSWDTSLQEHVPAHALSRVAAYDDLLSYIAIPAGQLSVGPLAHLFGPFAVAGAAGVLYAAAALTPLWWAEVRRLPHAGAGVATRPPAAAPAAASPRDGAGPAG